MKTVCLIMSLAIFATISVSNGRTDGRCDRQADKLHTQFDDKHEHASCCRKQIARPRVQSFSSGEKSLNCLLIALWRCVWCRFVRCRSCTLPVVVVALPVALLVVLPGVPWTCHKQNNDKGNLQGYKVTKWQTKWVVRQGISIMSRFQHCLGCIMPASVNNYMFFFTFCILPTTTQ